MGVEEVSKKVLFAAQKSFLDDSNAGDTANLHSPVWLKKSEFGVVSLR